MLKSMIDAKTNICAVIGNPVGHSLSPLIHNKITETLEGRGVRLNMAYAAFNVLPEKLREAVRGAHALGIRGLNITAPHKINVVELCAEADETVLAAGAANTLVYTPDGYKCYNTDIYGALSTLESSGVCAAGKTVVILGGGGAAGALAVAAGEAGGAEVVFSCRSDGHVKIIAKNIEKRYNIPVRIFGYGDEKLRGLKRCDIVINTVPAGLTGGVGGILRGAEFALDLSYSPWETEFMKTAGEAGALTSNGFPFLVYQACAAYERFFGLSFENGFADQMIKTVKEML